MSRKKLLFVYNPFSGKGGINRSLCDIITIFTAEGYDVTVHPTSRKGDGQEFIEKYGGEYDLVCSCGGDGTLHELINGIGSEKRCAYIPAGTMNDFASSLKIPRVLTEAADMIVRGNFARIDAGRFNGVRFAYIAAFGAFTEVSYSTDRTLKSFFGAFAYFIEGLKLFDLNYFSEKSVRCEITDADSGETVEGDFVFGMAGNTLSVAGFNKMLTAGAAMDDGILDCLFIKMPKSISELDGIRVALLDESRPSENVIRLKTRRLVIESEKPVGWDLDGEYGGSTSRAEISNEKQSLLIAVPADTAPSDSENGLPY